MKKIRVTGMTVLAVAAVLACAPALGQGGFGEADADSDGKVTASELEKYVAGKLPGFDRFKELMKELDVDKDGSISESEFANRMTAVESVQSREKPSEETPQRQRRARRDTRPSLKVGDVAPTFKLTSLDGESETDLADFKGKKPVVLIFGSYT